MEPFEAAQERVITELKAEVERLKGDINALAKLDHPAGEMVAPAHELPWFQKVVLDLIATEPNNGISAPGVFNSTCQYKRTITDVHYAIRALIVAKLIVNEFRGGDYFYYAIPPTCTPTLQVPNAVPGDGGAHDNGEMFIFWPEDEDKDDYDTWMYVASSKDRLGDDGIQWPANWLAAGKGEK